MCEASPTRQERFERRGMWSWSTRSFSRIFSIGFVRVLLASGPVSMLSKPYAVRTSESTGLLWPQLRWRSRLKGKLLELHHLVVSGLTYHENIPKLMGKHIFLAAFGRSERHFSGDGDTARPLGRTKPIGPSRWAFAACRPLAPGVVAPKPLHEQRFRWSTAMNDACRP